MAATTAAAATASRSLWSKLSAVPATYPFAFGVAFSGVKTSVSDLLVQKVVEQKEWRDINWKRNGAFAAFGFVYLGGVQYALYVPVFGRLFPQAAAFAAKDLRAKLKDRVGLFQLAAQVFVDQCIHHPLLYFPSFYITKELVMNPQPDVWKALDTYRGNMVEDLKALWKIWVPAMLMNFAFMPMYLRIPCVAGTSLLWTCVLSAMRGGDVAHGEDLAGGAVTGASLVIMREGLGTILTSPAGDLERDRSHAVLTAAGRDKPGWVAALSRAVADEGGNVTHSKMVRLGREFIIQMHVSLPPEKSRRLLQSLRRNPNLKGLDIRSNVISRRGTGSFDAPQMSFHIRCVGADKVGMLASISESLRDHGLSIENVTTELQKSKAHGIDFVVQADCVTTKFMTHDEIMNLVGELSHMKQELGLDVVDVRVHRLNPTRE